MSQPENAPTGSGTAKRGTSNITKAYIMGALDAGKSQAELVAKTGVAQPSISRMYGTIKARAEFLGVGMWDEGAYDGSVAVTVPKPGRGGKRKADDSGAEAAPATPKRAKAAPKSTPKSAPKSAAKKGGVKKKEAVKKTLAEAPEEDAESAGEAPAVKTEADEVDEDEA